MGTVGEVSGDGGSDGCTADRTQSLKNRRSSHPVMAMMLAEGNA